MFISLFINIIYYYILIFIYVTLKLVNTLNWPHHFTSTVSATD